MKKKMAIVVLMICCMLLSACGYKETKEYPIASMRVWTDITHDGTFVIKTYKHTYVEVIYGDQEDYKKRDVAIYNIQISNENKVVEEKECSSPVLYLTIDDYEDLFSGIETYE